MIVGFLGNEKSPGPRTRCMAALAVAYGVEFFYFTPERIDVEQGNVIGLFFDTSIKCFKEKEIKISKIDIINDFHDFNFKYPELFKLLSKTSVMCTGFNRLGGKTKVYGVLEKAGYSKYLINTSIYNGENIDDIFKNYKSIIFKPIRGNQGKSVYKLSKENGVYCLHYEHELLNLSKAEFLSKYSAILKGYLVQEYIESITNQGNPFDIRINTRRGRDGKWIVKKMFVRIGNVNGLVSNIHHGGSLGFPKQFLTAEFGFNSTQILNELNTIARELPDAMQKHYDVILDDLGFDVGINRAKNNQLKLFEVNTLTAPLTFELEALEARFHYFFYLYENYNEIIKVQKKGY